MIFDFRHVTKKKPVQAGNSSIPDEPILRDINFTVDGNDPQLILGPSGSGKTTLLRLFNRLTDPDDGEILYHGRNVKSYDVITLRMRIGFVSQIPVMLDGSVLSNFKYAVRHVNDRAVNNSEFEEECKQLLRFLNVSDTLLYREADSLSVGEKQRVALARTLIRNPEVLLLDEPTSALDPTATARFLDIVQKLRDEMNVTIIMVTHSIEQAGIIGGNAVVLVHGSIVEQGSVEKIIADPEYDLTKKFVGGMLDN